MNNPIDLRESGNAGDDYPSQHSRMAEKAGRKPEDLELRDLEFDGEDQ